MAQGCRSAPRVYGRQKMGVSEMRGRIRIPAETGPHALGDVQPPRSAIRRSGKSAGPRHHVARYFIECILGAPSPLPSAAATTPGAQQQQWLHCLKCSRGWRKIYGGRYFQCRLCYCLQYASQSEKADQPSARDCQAPARQVGWCRRPNPPMIRAPFFGQILCVEWVRLPAVLTRPGRPFDHAPDRLGAIGSAIDVEVAKRSELGGDLAQAPPLSRLGLARCSRLASATTSGRASRCDCRPSTLPLARLRSRAAFSFLTNRVFSSCENTPMICRIATRNSSSLSVRSSPPAVHVHLSFPRRKRERKSCLLG
jgi:hypothetical protein